MADAEQFWRASELHAHQWILTHSEPIAELPASCSAFGRIFVCPACGKAWGKRTFITAAPVVLQAVNRPCSDHGGGGLTRGRDYDNPCSDDLAAFLVAQYFLDRSVLDFHD